MGRSIQRDEESVSKIHRKDEKVEILCTACNSGRILHDNSHGERVCDNCGLIVEDELVDTGPEWRASSYQEREKKSRVGTPTTERLHDRGLTTEIDWQDEDASGRSLSPEKRSQMDRLRRWQKRIRTNDVRERNLQFAFGEIDRMASALGIPKAVREVTSVLYRRALQADLIRGRSIEGVATAALYASCRQEGLPRSLEEITEVSRVDRTVVSRIHRNISNELNLELPPIAPEQYVPRFCSRLDLSPTVEAKASEIIEETADPLLSGRGPSGFAAAAIYIAARFEDEGRTQQEVADAAQVTAFTVHKRYREQIEMLNPEQCCDS